mmetsp:Transcript_91898/g.145333  ORF Transcript_91898/g.145333 Transcript_91898/m.145333 type:complete len:85 (+) Transcript_91898:139-393(+)
MSPKHCNIQMIHDESWSLQTEARYSTYETSRTKKSKDGGGQSPVDNNLLAPGSISVAERRALDWKCNPSPELITCKLPAHCDLA